MSAFYWVCLGVAMVVAIAYIVAAAIDAFRQRRRPWWDDSNEIRCINRGCGKLFTEHEIDLDSQPFDQNRREADFNGAAWGGRWKGLYCPQKHG